MTLETDLHAFLRPDLSFTDRPSYVAWRTEWRSLYALVSKTIHDDKAAIRKAASAGEYTGNAQGGLVYLRSQAALMMGVRADAKERGRIARAKALGLLITVSEPVAAAA